MKKHKARTAVHTKGKIHTEVLRGSQVQVIEASSDCLGYHLLSEKPLTTYMILHLEFNKARCFDY
jgi:hypothetical protein